MISNVGKKYFCNCFQLHTTHTKTTNTGSYGWIKAEIGSMARFFCLLNKVPKETCFLLMFSQNQGVRTLTPNTMGFYMLTGVELFNLTKSYWLHMGEDKSDPANFSDINNLFCKVCWNQEQPKGLDANAGWCIWRDCVLASNETRGEREEKLIFKKRWKWEASFIKLWPIRLQYWH